MRIEFLNNINSKALESMTEKKLSKLGKFFKGEEPTVSVSYQVDNRNHLVTLQTKYNNANLISKGKSEDMYKSLDIAIDNLKVQMSKNKFDKKTKRTLHTYEDNQEDEEFTF